MKDISKKKTKKTKKKVKTTKKLKRKKGKNKKKIISSFTDSKTNVYTDRDTNDDRDAGNINDDQDTTATGTMGGTGGYKNEDGAIIKIIRYTDRDTNDDRETGSARTN